MTLKTLDFETGPDGADLTGNATTGGNSGAAQVTLNGGTGKFSTRLVRSGALGARIVSVANALAIARFNFTATNLTASLNLPFVVETAPPSNFTTLMSLRFSSGVAARLNWYPDNSLGITDAAAGSLLTLGTGLTPGAGYEVSIRAKAATSTTGTITAVLYTAAGVQVGSATSSTYNLGTAALAAIDVGIVNTNPAAGTAVAFDYIQLNDGSTAELRAPSAGTNYQGTLGLTGAGTLAQAGTATSAAALPLAGAGTVTQATTAAGAGVAALAGSGALTQAATATGNAALPVTGSGALNETATVAGTSSATNNGTGTLSITATTNQTSSLDLIATGSLDMATSAQRVAAVALAGSGTFNAASAGGAQTARLDLTTVGILELSSTVAYTGSVNLASAGTLELTVGGTEHHDLLELAGTATLSFTELGKQRDITVTATIQPRAWAATANPRRYAATQQPRRWDAHADVPTRDH
jgi:hypothetical protein